MGRYVPLASVNGDADTIDGLDSTALELASNKGQINGYAPLDVNLEVPDSFISDGIDIDGGTF